MFTPYSPLPISPLTVIISLYYSTDWLLDLAILVLFYILAGPKVPIFINRVYCTSCTALGGIIYLVLTSVLL